MAERPDRVSIYFSLIMLVLGAAGTVRAVAQEPLSVAGRAQAPVFLNRVDVLRVSPQGVVDGGGGAGPRGNCGVEATHTDADFTGGSFVVQGGFAETEWLAASYVIPAAAFPIRIDLVECIFATSNATVATTTEWSIGFWDGRPNNGTLVALYSSDGTILPHIILPPGTNGVNVQFSVNPGDPEQVILENDSGTAIFSVGFRIDDHNQQTQNPCFTAPPSCCNAFPTTDVSGLANSANNWLNGINCGPFGCPANGGWASFAGLPLACRPSGDWVLRVTWSSISCQPGVGPCCLNGDCQVRTAPECDSLGGVYQGDGTSCDGVSCPQSLQACCFQTGGCLNLIPSDCTSAGGTPAGAGTSCGGGACNPQGACCLPNGSCIGNVTAAECAGAGGVYRGNGSTCSSGQCNFACCFSTGFCLSLSRADCDQAGATWSHGETCADGNGNGQADACESPACPGDIDGDGDVDLGDLTALLAHFGEGSGNPPGDLDGDGDVDLSDLTVELANFGNNC